MIPAYDGLDPSAPALEPASAETEETPDPLQQYWANFPAEELGEQLSNRVQNYGSATLTSGQYSRYARAYQYYFGLDPSGIHATSQVLRGGEMGELAAVRVNHCRSLVNTLLNLIVAPKIVWTPKAVNIDYQSVRECELAASVLEFYWVEKRVNLFANRAVEEALVFTEGFTLVEWDESAGDDFAALPGEPPVKTGDVSFRSVSTWDVIRDSNKPTWESLDWVIVRVYRNKFDLVAKHPEYAEEILSYQDDERVNRRAVTRPSGNEETDDVPVYYFFHKRTAACPEGREAMFLPNISVLREGPLRYESIPLYRISAGELVGTPFGYSPFFEVLGVQELYDSLESSIASNQSTLGTQVVVMEQGSDVPMDQIAGGMRAIYYPPGGKPPQGLNLTSTPPEMFKHLEILKKEMELLFGLNSVVRGEPQSGELSGSALALLQSQALQQSSTLQSAYLRYVQGLGDCVLYLIKTYASMPLKVAITGKGNSFLVSEAEVSTESMQRVKKVQVEIGNPLSQTHAGRIELAKELLKMGVVKTNEQFQQVLLTGRLEPLTQSLSNELLLIRSENEQLMKGEQPPALVLDDHLLHAREHRAVLANPEARRQPEVVQAVLAHIDEHEQLYYAAPPSTLAMVGQTPPMIAPPGMGPEGGPGPGPSPMGGPMGGQVGGANSAGSQPKPGELSPGGAPKPPKKAAPPKNPATGQPHDPVTGGGLVPPPGAAP